MIGSSTRSLLLATRTQRPWVYWVDEADLAALRGHRLGGVLDQVEEHLDQLVAVAVDLGQRRVVVGLEADLAREAALGQAADVLEHLVDVDRAALDRPVVGELLHAVDQARRSGRSRRRSAGSAGARRRSTPCSSSCAAPRMPDSGFLTSWASVAPSPATERAPPRWVSWWLRRCATEQGCRTTRLWPGALGERRDVQVDQAA